MYTIDNNDLFVMLNNFYSTYFVDYFEAVLADESDELSAVTLFQGMNYFIDLCNRLKIELPFKDIKQYIENNYQEGEKLFDNIYRKYTKELREFPNSNVSLKENFGTPDFLGEKQENVKKR